MEEEDRLADLDHRGLVLSASDSALWICQTRLCRALAYGTERLAPLTADQSRDVGARLGAIGMPVF